MTYTHQDVKEREAKLNDVLVAAGYPATMAAEMAHSFAQSWAEIYGLSEEVA